MKNTNQDKIIIESYDTVCKKKAEVPSLKSGDKELYSNGSFVKKITLVLFATAISFTIALKLTKIEGTKKTPGKLKVKQTFIRSKKIWGTWDLVNENIMISSDNKNYSKKIKNNDAILTFKKNNVFIVRPVNVSTSKMHISVGEFPYLKTANKKTKKKSYQLFTKETNHKLIDFYQLPIKDIIKNKKLLTKESISFNNYSCVKKGSRKMVCHITGTIKNIGLM